MTDELPAIVEQQRRPAPAKTPQALAWHRGAIWMGSRDLRRVYVIDPSSWKVTHEFAAPGIPWAAVSAGEDLAFTLGEGVEDDRYVQRYRPDRGFLDEGRIPCPDLTGSYLSYDGQNLFLSQWYQHRILKLGASGEILRVIDVGAEICGHTFVQGTIHVLFGTEQQGESWQIGRLDSSTDRLEPLAEMNFACRSLAFDGERFWSNHRAANEIVAFTLP